MENFGNILRHRRLIYPLPHAPDTPGGCEHADEVSLTPMGMPTRAIRSNSRSCLVEGRTPSSAHTRSVVDELQPRQLPFDNDAQDDGGVADRVVEDEIDAVNLWLDGTLSPERQSERMTSQTSLSTGDRGIHWGRWDIVDDEARAEIEEREETGCPSIDLSDDSAKLSTSPPSSVSSDDAIDKNDSTDAKSSLPIPEDATAPGVNDIFTGCLDTIREHLMFGVFHHRRAYERAEAARLIADQRRNNRPRGGKAPYNRSRNNSRQTKGKNSNGARQQHGQQFQPPPPPSAPPPGTAKRPGNGYFSEEQHGNALRNELESHFPQVRVLQGNESGSSNAPQRPRSPRPSPTFPQAWAGVVQLPPKFGPPESEPAPQNREPVTMASVLKEVEEKLSLEATLAKDSPPPAPPPMEPSKPSWGPKGSAPLDVLKANASKPVLERQHTVVEETTPTALLTEETSPQDHSDDSAKAPAPSTKAQGNVTKQKRVRSRKGGRSRPLTSEFLECESTFPSLGGSPNSESVDRSAVDVPKSWAAKLL